MCGIAGIYGGGTDDILIRMLTKLQHRGPDDAGVWREGDLALGHRRLSIVDLSPAGHQPMVSASGKTVLIYNGEIYNFEALRAELDRSAHRPQWRGHSDTEVLLACIEAWGIQRTLELCNGMYAFALWDRSDHTLTLARDRMGEKPLYFGWPLGRFAFASELKALFEIDGWSPRMNDVAISSFLQTGYVRGHQSALDGIYRLPPACILTLDASKLGRKLSWNELAPSLRPYWSLQEAASVGLNGDGSETQDQLLITLDELLHDAVKKRMVADVPIGAFLSGGIDSSLVTAMMQQHSSQAIRTFSIGFNESDHDEAPHARAVARHIGTDHTELYLSASDALKLVPSLANTFDEPFADSSQMPTLLVSKLARESVTVALSGDGGDELFAGYGRYVSILQLWTLLAKLSPTMRNACATSISSATCIPGMTTLSAAHKLKRFAERIRVAQVDDLRLSFIGGAGVSRIQGRHASKRLDHGAAPSFIQSPLRRLLFSDQADYLPDDILHKVDRASMTYSLETRIPFLDHRVVELSWRLSDSTLLTNKVGKLPLRKLLDRYVPFSLIDRPKQGFAPPIADWLRGPLREWAETLLATDSLREIPQINGAEVRKLWLEHARSRIDASQVLWSILMLCNWRSSMKIGCSS